MKKMILSFFLFSLILIPFAFSQDQGNMTANGFKEIIDTEISFQWKIEGESLRIILSAPTEGWVAVGFNPSRVMKDADYKLAYVDGTETVMEDHFGTALFAHKSDTEIGGTSDFEIISGKEEMGKTIIEFRIPLNSGDDKDTLLMEGSEVKVLLAYGTRDNLSQKHKKRTSVAITL
jgi:hypothetical protein